MNHDIAFTSSYETSSRELSKDFTTLNTCSYVLPERTGNHEYDGTVLRNTFTQKIVREYPGGNIEEGLSHLIVVGDTVLGVSRVIDRGRQGPGAVSRMRLSVLPLGEHGSSIGSSATILEVNPSELVKPRQSGVVQLWEMVKVGRSELAKLTTDRDPRVSASHLEVTFDSTGGVKIEDLGSTNGTRVYTTMEDFAGPITQEDYAVLGRMADELQQHPHMWDSESAGYRVITPYAQSTF